MRKLHFSLMTVAAVTAIATAWAQEKAVSVDVSGSVQDGFVRLVFASDNLPKATVSKDGNTVTLKFPKDIALDNVTAAVAGITPAPSITASANTVTIKAEGLTRDRTLFLGNRLLVDLFTQAAPKQDKTAVVAKTEEKPTEKPKAETLAASTSLITDTHAQAPAAKLPTPEQVAAPVPATTATATSVVTPTAETAPQKVFTGSATITIGSTQGLALAAFVRSGYLWIVLSQEQLTVPPLASGPDAALLGPIDAVAIDGGSAYRVKLPEGAYVRPEGAGLVWRLYIEGAKPNLKSVGANRDFSNTAEGPQVHIPLTNAISALKLPDPLIGDDLAVITVGRAETRLIASDQYVDFDMLPAIVGAVIRPKADGMRIAVLPKEVVVSRAGGLRISASGPRPPAREVVVTKAVDAPKEAAPTQIYNMKDWALGGPKQFLDMRRSIDEKIATASDDRKLPELISGAKFMLAQGLPEEANGFVQMAQSFMPALRESAEFQSLSGAVLALTGNEDQALSAFSTPGLESNDEIALWKAYTLARQNKLADAQKAMPKTAVALINTYPARLQDLLLRPLIEAQLAFGDVTIAESMVDLYDKASESSIDFDHEHGVAFYRGRIAQLRGDIDASSEFYRTAAEGLQGPFPVRATLALVERGLSARTLSREDAVRKLERFRYGWRGDALESEILQRLGLVYVTGGEQRRGLTILRDAAAMAPDPAIREKLVAVMQKAFRELFSGKTKEKMTPIESAAIAAEFAELMPAGGDGEQITMTIADQMVAVDLLDRAANMIEPMVTSTANPADAIRYAIRAGTIRLLNGEADDALKILDKALARSDIQGKPLASADQKRVTLLRAKAKADMGKTDDALSELNTIPEDAETLRLAADISWKGQRWAIAADSFSKLVRMSNLSATKPPTQAQAQLVLNQALALNLGGDTQRLNSLRIAYGDIMRRSDLNQQFLVVTRSARSAELADRETLLKLVSEVNMFKDILVSYTKDAPVAKPEAAKPADAAAKPAEEPKKE